MLIHIAFESGRHKLINIGNMVFSNLYDFFQELL